MALVKCAECTKEISEKATACPYCGAPRSAKAQRAKKRGLWPAIILIVGAVIVIAMIQNQANERSAESALAEQQRQARLTPAQRAAEEKAKRAEDSARQQERMEGTARFMCREWVKKGLHDPGSAQFQHKGSEYSQVQKDGSILVQVQVRAKNAFNALRLVTFDCRMKNVGGTWMPLSLKQIN